MTVRDLRIQLSLLPQEKEVLLLVPRSSVRLHECEPKRIVETVFPPDDEEGKPRDVIVIEWEETEDWHTVPFVLARRGDTNPRARASQSDPTPTRRNP